MATETVTRRLRYDLCGQRFGRWTVIGVHSVGRSAETLWTCKCDCGTEKAVFSNSLRRGVSQSCGCLARELRTTHGQTDTPAFRRWHSMISRCTYKSHNAYPGYGGRGITVCERWQKFENFYADMGDAPTPQHSLDRIDNDGPYSPENCRWATREEQSNNTRANHYITLDEERLTVMQAARRSGIKFHTLERRLRLGWDVRRAVSTPPRFIRQTEKLVSYLNRGVTKPGSEEVRLSK